MALDEAASEGGSRRRAWVSVGLTAFVLALVAVLPARPRTGPRVPAPGEVLTTASPRAARPVDEVGAVALARALLDEERRSGDPRLLGRAVAALAPWLASDEVQGDTLLLAAEAAWRAGELKPAQAHLRQAGSRQASADALGLLEARVFSADGQLSRARGGCHLVSQGIEREACLAWLEGLSGDAAAGLRRLGGGEESAWAREVEGHLHAWLGQDAEAVAAWQRALALDETALAARVAAARALVRLGRAGEAVALLEPWRAHDEALLGLAEALAAAGRPEAAEARAELRARVGALAGRGGVSGRVAAAEAVRFGDDAARAVRLASEHFARQKLPDDLALLLEAARRAGDAAAARQARAWLAESGFRSAEVSGLLEGLP